VSYTNFSDNITNVRHRNMKLITTLHPTLNPSKVHMNVKAAKQATNFTFILSQLDHMNESTLLT